MKKKYFKILPSMALMALLCMQGLWLYHTYIFFDDKIKNDLAEKFARSIEKEIYLRLDDDSRTPEGSVVEGARPDNDFYANALAFHEFLLSLGTNFSMETLDSIWSQKLSDDYASVGYLLQKTDSKGLVLEQIDKGFRDKSPLAYTVKRPIRKDNSEYLLVSVADPHRIVFGKLFLLLALSALTALFIGYCFYIQAKVLIRQERIANIRKDFTQGMVHELKKPTANILLSASVLTARKPDDPLEAHKPYIEIIRKGGNKLSSMINKIITIAKTDEDKIHLSKQTIDVKQMFEDLMEDYTPDLFSNIRFVTDFENAPVIHADREYMADVFSNLIDNAIKYSKESVAIHIKTEKAENHTLIKVRDNGIGISPKDQKRIFNKFERVRSCEEGRKSGFGLGLYYVRQIIAAHNGTIRVESTPNVYSEFTIRIPNKEQHDKTVIC